MKLQFWNPSRAQQPTMILAHHLVGLQRKELSAKHSADWSRFCNLKEFFANFHL